MHGSTIIFRYPALLAIRAYQRYLSPLKGYVCAYRVLTGRDSCSAYGYLVIERFGLLRGLALLRRRTRACSRHLQAHRTAAPAVRHLTARQRAQAGYCDCDLPSADCSSCACDASDMLDCCDWPRDKKKKTN